MAVILDKNKILQYIGTDETRINTLLVIFATDLRNHAKQLQTLAIDDWTNHHKLLHRLMGSASYFGTEDLKAYVKQAEYWCQHQQESQLTATLQQLYLEIERVLSCELLPLDEPSSPD